MPEPPVWVFAGDSITDGDHLWLPGEDGLGDSYVHLISEQLKKQRLMPFPKIINSGFNGFRAIDLKRRFDRVCISKKPQLVTLLVGVNEAGCAAEGMITTPAQFRETYESMVRDVIESGAHLILMEPFLFERPAYLIGWRKFLDPLLPVIKELAESWDVPFLSLDAELNTLAREEGIDAITIDGIHLTPRGNEYLAGRWLSCLDEMVLKWGDEILVGQ